MGNMDQALSLWFLLGWIGGDSCNLIGSFLADQLPLQVGWSPGWVGCQGQSAEASILRGPHAIERALCLPHSVTVGCGPRFPHLQNEHIKPQDGWGL